MKPMTVREIQDVSFDILRRLDCFCKERKIKYWLSDGTLLGAIRHKGFIPWDDDLDVTMPRPDYERFLKEFADDENYRLFAMQRGNSFLAYARLCEMKRTFFRAETIWSFEQTGVGIDIIPLDGAPEREEDFMTIYNSVHVIRTKLLFWRQLLTPVCNFRHTVVGFAKDCVRVLTSQMGKRLLAARIHSLLQEQLRIKKKYDFSVAKCCHAMIVFESRPHFWPKEWFAEVTEVEFCGEHFPAPIEYDKYLTEYFGDYMTPPPPEKREVHSGWQTMWWRD